MSVLYLHIFILFFLGIIIAFFYQNKDPSLISFFFNIFISIFILLLSYYDTHAHFYYFFLSKNPLTFILSGFFFAIIFLENQDFIQTFTSSPYVCNTCRCSSNFNVTFIYGHPIIPLLLILQTRGFEKQDLILLK